MIFRANITHEDGRQEVLQVCSQPIVCTQPPGVPEICKKSLTSCPASGGLELFVLGKNFSKDTKVYFQQISEDRLVRWEQAVVPDKEFLQQTHFVCVVPPFRRTEINEPVSVRLCVVANGKTSESHQFIYTPVNGALPSVHLPAEHTQTPFFNKMLWMPSPLSKREQDLDMMPPPETNLVPLSSRRSSINHSSNETHSPPLNSLKQEYIDESSQSSLLDSSDMHPERYRHISESSMDVHHGDSNISMINENSIDILHHENSNSVELMVRRNSMSQMQEKSLETTLTSNILNENNSVHYGNSFMPCNDIHSSNMSKNELEVMDLRMKASLATGADLANSSAPSLATIRNFVTETSNFPLPTQSAQSIERFLTNIEVKPIQSNPINSFKSQIGDALMHNPVFSQNMLSSSQEMSKNLCENTYMTSQPHSYMMDIASTRNSSNMCSLTSKPDTIISPTKNEINNSTIPLNNEKFDAFFNQPNAQIIPHVQEKVPVEQSSNTMLSASMVSQNLNNQIVQTLTSDHSNSNITSDVILNSQVSPSLMCQNSAAISQESLMPAASLCAPVVENNLNAQQQLALLPVSTSHNTINPMQTSIGPQVSSMEPEKAVILEATVDLLKTQKELSEFGKEPSLEKIIMNDLISITDQVQNVISNNGSLDTANIPKKPTNLITEPKPDLIIPVSVKEMQMVQTTTLTEKKMDDRLLTPSFVPDNELINFINPNCFDQNSSNYS